MKATRFPDALFPLWRQHPFFTDTEEPVDVADITHRRDATIEDVFAGPDPQIRAHMPDVRFDANSAWILGAAIARNLLALPADLAGWPAGPPCAGTSSCTMRPPRNADPSCT